MRVAIIGLGRVGREVELLFQRAEYQVVAWDVASAEPYPSAELSTCDFAVVCVDTPRSADGSADTARVTEAIERLPLQKVLIKSTVPPGTTERLAGRTGKSVCFWPEYVGESAYYNPHFPDRIEEVPFLIIGGEQPSRGWFIDRLQGVFGPTKHYFQCTAMEAEIIKYAENAYFATKVTFVNEFRQICDAFGADWHVVREGWLLDPRVERMHTAAFEGSPGFGGKCLPKDLDAIVRASQDAGYPPALLRQVASTNRRLRGHQPTSVASGEAANDSPESCLQSSEEGVLIKALPEDFVVEECGTPVLPCADGEFTLLRVTKRGLTTFAAVGMLSETLGVPREEIGYAGLKDEDGITTQLMSLPAKAGPDNEISIGSEERDETHLLARTVGKSRLPIRIGAHGGNMFSLIARNLPGQLANELQEEPDRTVHFLNYYDLQRFGLPDRPKVTHLIGEALTDGDYDTAFGWLKHGQAVEEQEAGQLPAAYFGSLDQRQVAFFMSAFESFRWNSELSALVRETSATPRELTREEISITLPAAEADCLAVLRKTPSLPRPRHIARGSEIVEEVSERATVVQAHVSIDDIHQDGETWSCRCSFFLPPGCYATMLITQLFA